MAKITITFEDDAAVDPRYPTCGRVKMNASDDTPMVEGVDMTAAQVLAHQVIKLILAIQGLKEATDAKNAVTFPEPTDSATGDAKAAE